MRGDVIGGRRVVGDVHGRGTGVAQGPAVLRGPGAALVAELAPEGHGQGERHGGRAFAGHQAADAVLVGEVGQQPAIARAFGSRLSALQDSSPGTHAQRARGARSRGFGELGPGPRLTRPRDRVDDPGDQFGLVRELGRAAFRGDHPSP
ncbi:hypothetical protein [Streptomyces sp. NBC_01236]|uniref:hypothetical protein n=1 Tax=Streptomyces sp. NBC_01236 TaxID=2903789 RepID=UPI002E11B1F0|nr:hypothetical protein OG324_33730 [Streptomyces sp. NBC_01236]